jgi:uncharacterized protein with HEPN domain
VLVAERLADLLDYCDEAAILVDAGREAFFASVIHRRAAEAVLNRIGTTVSAGLPEELLVRHPEVDWAALRGMHNRVGHEPRAMDWEIVWTTIERDLPALRNHVAGHTIDPVASPEHGRKD